MSIKILGNCKGHGGLYVVFGPTAGHHQVNSAARAGAFNAKQVAWGNPRRNRNEVILQQGLEEGYFNILGPDAPTRLRRYGAHAIIDLVTISQPIVHQELSSDHYPVLAEVESSVNRHLTTLRNYHRVNWDQFRQCDDTNVGYEERPETADDINRQL